jgi:hypothetical protein
MLNEKAREKAPSKKLKEKILACVSSFQKVGTAVKEALDQGRKEGFIDKDIGKMIREEMLQAGFERSTIAGYLPSSAKQKPRGKPGSHKRISGKNPQTEAVENPKLEQKQIQGSDFLAKEDLEEQKKKTKDKNNILPEERIVDVQLQSDPPDSIIQLQSASIELDPAEGKYDIENLQKYSKSALERLIKLQHKHLQEGHKEGALWKSKYISLKLAYKKDTGKDWVD